MYTSGKRIKGKVIPGTEKLQIFSPWKVLIKKQLEYLSTLFDNYQFNACIKIIDNIEKITTDPEIIEKIKRYKNICEGYYQWDIFNHEKAKEILLKEKKVPDKNKEFLGKLSSSKEKEIFLIADLLNNSKRRSMEGKYDDAVARLYRVIELLALYILKKDYDIDTSDVQLDKITEVIKNHPNLKDDLEKRKG